MKNKLLLSLMTLLLLAGCAPKNQGQDPISPSQDSEPETEIIKYSISFYDDEGTIIKTEEIEAGQTPSFDYTKPSDDDYDYTFVGWSLTLGGEVADISAATDDASYYLVVSSTNRHYSIQFLDSDTTKEKIRKTASSQAYDEFEERYFYCRSTSVYVDRYDRRYCNL